MLAGALANETNADRIGSIIEGLSMPASNKAPANKPAAKATVSRVYFGETADERIKVRRQKLIDTAFALMAESGWRKVTIDHLCKQAELNKRYFYESFENLDALAAAVVDGLCAQLVEISLGAAQDALSQSLSTAEIAHRALSAAIGFITDDSRRAHVLFTEVADTPQAVAHRQASIQLLANTLAAYGHEHHKAEGQHAIASVASALLVGGTIEVIKSWLAGNIAQAREELIDDLTKLWVYAGDGAVEIGKAKVSQKSTNTNTPKRKS